MSQKVGMQRANDANFSLKFSSQTLAMPLFLFSLAAK